MRRSRIRRERIACFRPQELRAPRLLQPIGPTISRSWSCGNRAIAKAEEQAQAEQVERIAAQVGEFESTA